MRVWKRHLARIGFLIPLSSFLVVNLLGFSGCMKLMKGLEGKFSVDIPGANMIVSYGHWWTFVDVCVVAVGVLIGTIVADVLKALFLRCIQQ